MSLSIETRSRELLRGAVDTHIHTAPDIYPRSVTVIEAGRNAKAAGMKAILVKSHCTDTSDRAELASKLAGFPVFGGVTLNYPVGGINIHAVRESIRQGGKQVWMPSTSSRPFFLEAGAVPVLAKSLPLGVEGITILNEKGRLIPEICPILNLIAENAIALATSHISPREALLLVKAAREAGIERITVTHPHASFLAYSVEQMLEMGRLGAKLEFHYAFTTAAVRDRVGVADLAKVIRAVGPEHCILATDGGQDTNPPPHEMLRLFIAGMLESGFADDEIQIMTSRNPGRVLGLS